jgi:hypothetical protein
MKKVKELRSIDADREARSKAVSNANREAGESNYNKNNIDYRCQSEDMLAEQAAASLRN